MHILTLLYMVILNLEGSSVAELGKSQSPLLPAQADQNKCITADHWEYLLYFFTADHLSRCLAILLLYTY
jgi:hypothetical protein